MLERTGFAVLTAATGHDAIEMIRNHSDDFVLALIDMNLPDLTGAETLRSIRKIKEGIPAIFMSGHMKEDLHDLLKGHRATGFLQKPYRQAQLIAAVQRALEEQ
jgi:CheY-like chemotaxis protein